MQNKGAIRLFAILLALVSIYHLSFTWVTNSIRSDAEEFAQGDTTSKTRYLDSISSVKVYDLLIQDFTFRECQEKELNLGLDLRGGMNLTMEVSLVDLIRSLANNSKDETFNNALKLAKEKQKDSQKDFVTLFYEAFEEIDPGARLASIFSTRELKEKNINFESTNEEVINVIREETKDAIDNSFNIIRSRIDHFGIAQPNIQRLATEGQILVELPGVKDKERVRKLLQRAAKLEFWETYDNSKDVYPRFIEANTKLAQILEAKSKTEKNEPETFDSNDAEDEEAIQEEEVTENNDETSDEEATVDETETTEQADSLKVEEDTEDDLMAELEGKKDSTEIAAQTQEEIRKKNPLFSILYPYVNQQGSPVQGAAVGYCHFKDTAKVSEYLNMPQIKRMFPREMHFFWSFKPMGDNENIYQLIAVKESKLKNGAALSGEVITNARQEFDNTTSRAKVTMSMDGTGTKEWARITRDNVGKQVAVVLDNYVYSFPVVNSEISGGSSEISGNFTPQEAKDLANVLKSGKMPAPARIISSQVVGPSLGEESINSGLISFLIAFIVVMIYMILYYRSAGIVADLALLANIFFIFGVLSAFGAVLTLPGIAGIVLTVGISVDANVLIYERVREELSQGKNLRRAISDGYRNAYSAIIDANVTSLLTAIILGVFGKGPIQGFATTLGIGILTSLFSAIFITRLIFERYLDKNRNITFSTKLTQGAFSNINIDFLGKRKVFYIVSGIIIALGIISLVGRGLNYGVDFKGGRYYVVRFDQPVSTVNVASALKDGLGDSPEVKTFGGSNQVKITTDYGIDSESTNIDSEIEEILYSGLKSMNKENLDKKTFVEDYIVEAKKVGPTIADDIKLAALKSIFGALFFIFIYIFIRFKDWRYGLGAVGALAHDTLIVLGLFSIFYGILPFSLEIDQAFIAAILTVIGYSINDTVVVFDRIREFGLLHKKGDRAETVNKALNSTLSRTLSTSLSTLVVLLTVFFFGGEVIRGFIFAMVVGVVVGTYSSLFIATPIVFDTEKVIDKQAAKLAEIKEKRKAKKKIEQ